MRSYHLETTGGLVLREGPSPEPGPTEIVVRVRAVSLNKRDLMILDGDYPLPATPGVIPLSDGAGDVVAAGELVTRFGVGDRVMGSYWPRWTSGRLRPELIDQLGCTVDGMLTEYAVLDQEWAVAVPEHLSWAEAATLPCAGLTAWTSLTGGDALLPGQTVVTLGSGGVSLFAVQLAKAMGLTVIATTSDDSRVKRLTSLGADHVINYVTTPEWSHAVRDLTFGRGADLVIDTAGPDTIDQSLRASALYGQVVVLITRNGRSETLQLTNQAYASTLTTLRRVFVGSRENLESLSAAVSAHGLRPVIDRTFPFAAARDAYDHYATATSFGKTIIA